MATNSLIPVRGARRRLPLLVSAAALLVAGIGAQARESTAAGKAEVPASYHWPVKPFDRQHPVRGGFSDPRTVFSSRATLDGVLRGRGSFTLHRGIDISAPDGTPVYPVASGEVTVANAERIRVNSGGGRSFEYWHIHRTVSVGDHVDAYTTVIGHVMRSAQHVHLTELDNEFAVNPLAPGHLGPYRDSTTPLVTSISFRRVETGRDLLPGALRGNVILVAAAEDLPTIDAPGGWRGLAITPALVSWEVRGLDGKAVVPRQIAYDARGRLPGDGNFWKVYVRGTYQNMAMFRGHFSYGQRGAYLFRLSPAKFNTRQLRNAAYDLVVIATDIRGNSSSLTRRFAVDN
jgi:Peptidase family M23